MGKFLGTGVYHVDRAALRFVRTGPSTKIMVVRRLRPGDHPPSDNAAEMQEAQFGDLSSRVCDAIRHQPEPGLDIGQHAPAPGRFAAPMAEGDADLVTPSIDVVIPTFNRWELTKACLGSLVEQTLEHTVVLVDNGSTDGTPASSGSRSPR